MTKVEELKQKVYNFDYSPTDKFLDAVDELIQAVRDEEFEAREAKKNCEDDRFRRWVDNGDIDVDCLYDCPANGTRYCP